MRSLLLCTLLLAGITPLQAQVDYATQIQTIFNAQCNSCHSNGQRGFNSSSYEAVMASRSSASTYNGPYVIAGDADGSPLVDKIEPNPQFGGRMPNSIGIASEQISLIRQWIDEGANRVATNNESDPDLPDNFTILGNYPNPFNPSTHIQFTVPEAATYTVSVFTVHGKLIMEQTGNISAGLADISLDLDNNPTGMYIYQIRAALSVSGQVVTGMGRMTLIK